MRLQNFFDLIANMLRAWASNPAADSTAISPREHRGYLATWLEKDLRFFSLLVLPKNWMARIGCSKLYDTIIHLLFLAREIEVRMDAVMPFGLAEVLFLLYLVIHGWWVTKYMLWPVHLCAKGAMCARTSYSPDRCWVRELSPHGAVLSLAFTVL